MAVFDYELGSEVAKECTGGAVTLGNFDGVHRGHQALLAETIRLASQINGPAVAVTFDPPPTQLLRPDEYQPLLTPIAERAALMQSHGIDHVLVLRTTRELLQLEAQAFFERILRDGLGARGIVEGYNFAFGRGRRGTIEMLTALGKENAIAVHLVPPQEMQGKPVSSSRVRAELLAGNVGDVRGLLGRPYRLLGRVGTGQKRGRTLGFPTANLEEVSNLIPGNGVYAVCVPRNQHRYAGAANIGPNPTFGENARKVEVHLLDFDGDLYGQQLEVDFHAKIRDTRPFSSAQELVEQIRTDVQTARQLARLYAELPRTRGEGPG
jgi:riboflavin kinase/FMN adenylyltransferase